MPVIVMDPGDDLTTEDEAAIYEQYKLWLAAHPDSTTSFESWLELVQ